MKQIWKWVMHLNAKAFCLIALVLLCATGGWCVYQINTPLEPIRDGTGKLPDPPKPWEIGILDFVNGQLAGEDVSIPIEPFRPTMEAILLDPEAKAALIAAMNAARNPQGGPPGTRPTVWPNNKVGTGTGTGGPGTGTAADTGPKMITPKITFLGFMKRTDGSSVAMFSDSYDKSTIFYTPGKKVHGLEILSADMKEAVVRLPDGTEKTLSIGGDPIELAPEPEKSAALPPAQG